VKRNRRLDAGIIKEGAWGWREAGKGKIRSVSHNEIKAPE